MCFFCATTLPMIFVASPSSHRSLGLVFLFLCALSDACRSIFMALVCIHRSQRFDCFFFFFNRRQWYDDMVSKTVKTNVEPSVWLKILSNNRFFQVKTTRNNIWRYLEYFLGHLTPKQFVRNPQRIISFSQQKQPVEVRGHPCCSFSQMELHHGILAKPKRLVFPLRRGSFVCDVFWKVYIGGLVGRFWQGLWIVQCFFLLFVVIVCCFWGACLLYFWPYYLSKAFCIVLDGFLSTSSSSIFTMCLAHNDWLCLTFPRKSFYSGFCNCSYLRISKNEWLSFLGCVGVVFWWFPWTGDYVESDLTKIRYLGMFWLVSQTNPHFILFCRFLGIDSRLFLCSCKRPWRLVGVVSWFCSWCFPSSAHVYRQKWPCWICCTTPCGPNQPAGRPQNDVSPHFVLTPRWLSHAVWLWTTCTPCPAVLKSRLGVSSCLGLHRKQLLKS